VHNHLVIKWTGFALALALFNSPHARAGYTYTVVADETTAAPNGLFSPNFSLPAISGGTVAFTGSYHETNGSISTGIFAGTGSGGSPTTIAKKGDAAPANTFTSFGARGPAISGGTTVFYGEYDEGQSTRSGIFTGNGGPKTTIAKFGDAATSGTTFSSFSDPAISVGTVAFRATYLGAQK
jgi:hypothetical protein